MTEPVRIVAYDAAWPERFEEERAALEEAIGPWVTGGVHHVGSTAVPGLAAKPVIDILVGVEGLEESLLSFERLVALDYLYSPYRHEEMHWFVKPDPNHRTHQLHLVPTDSPRFRMELRFRDVLRGDPALAGEYAALKAELAERFENDREGYTKAKTAFVTRVLLGG
ncbi:MAG: GrpB family protein [Thermoleophilaceae bacterium]|nr:GrpB family protein [Thermoleophilaceae bacterium]